MVLRVFLRRQFFLKMTEKLLTNLSVCSHFFPIISLFLTKTNHLVVISCSCYITPLDALCFIFFFSHSDFKFFKTLSPSVGLNFSMRITFYLGCRFFEVPLSLWCSDLCEFLWNLILADFKFGVNLRRFVKYSIIVHLKNFQELIVCSL